MKFKLDSIPEGVVVARILKPLSQGEADQIVVGMQKVLGNGKARIIIEFSQAAAVEQKATDYLEKSLRPLKSLAKKMGGDLLFVVPDPLGDKILGSFQALDPAIAAILGRHAPTVGDRGVLLRELNAKEEEVKRLKQENSFLEQRLMELSKLVGEPSTDEELKRGIEHYRALSAELELLGPADGEEGAPPVGPPPSKAP